MKAEVVDLLTALGLEQKRLGDLRRAGAYLRAANAIARRPDLDAVLAENRLRDIPGVGPSIERTIRAFTERGERPEWLPETPPHTLSELLSSGPEVPVDYLEAPFPDVADLHCHTTWSDGLLTLDELAALAERLGAKAIGVSDHSGSLKVARGLNPEDVRSQWADIERVQAAHPNLLILRGTECDILRDGTLDHPDDILRGFDYVIGSLHSHLTLPEEEQTERVLRAFENPHLTILGHPTTRVPGRREPAHLDLPIVFEAAAERGVALEINGNPRRMDLSLDLAREAIAAGAHVSLGSDAHSDLELFAIANARRTAEEAGAERDLIANYRVVERARERRAGALRRAA